MATDQLNSVVRQLRRAALLQEHGDLTDGQLLEGFLARRDEAAFEVLVKRHGPMVLGVCRRVLDNPHDAATIDRVKAEVKQLTDKYPVYAA